MNMDVKQSELGMLGVSVYHLETAFLDLVKNAGFSRSAKVYEAEDLQGPPGVIRSQSAGVVCPVDGRLGAAYVHCLRGEDQVGVATHMLSYTWRYVSW